MTDWVKAFGTSLRTEVVAELDKQFGDEHDWHSTRRDLADHFWCDLLAEFAHEIAKFNEALDEIPRLVTAAILQNRREDERSKVDGFVVEVAVNEAWKRVKALSIFGQVDQLLKVIRVLAGLMCPAPEKHRAVVIYCLNPLAGDLVAAETKSRLEQVLPGGWI